MKYVICSECYSYIFEDDCDKSIQVDDEYFCCENCLKKYYTDKSNINNLKNKRNDVVYIKRFINKGVIDCI